MTEDELLPRIFFFFTLLEEPPGAFLYCRMIGSSGERVLFCILSDGWGMDICTENYEY